MERDILQLVAYLLHWAVVVLAYKRMYSVFFDRRRSHTAIYIGSFVALFGIPAMLYLLFVDPLAAAIVIFVLIFSLTMNYHTSMTKRIVAMFAIIFITTVAEAAMLILLGGDVYSILADTGEDGAPILMYLSIALFTYMLAILMQKFKHLKIDHATPPPFSFWLALFVVPLSTFFIVASLLMSTGLPIWALIISTVSLTAITVYVFYMQDNLSVAYEEKLKAKLHQQQKEYYLAQTQTMEESMDKVRTIRHDMKEHLHTTHQFIAKGELDRALTYLEGILGEVHLTEIYSQTTNLAFDSIVNYSLRNVAEAGITPKLKLSYLPSDKIEDMDMATIMGNMLNNALAAVEKVEDKWIKVRTTYHKGLMTLTVTNPYVGEIKAQKGKILTTKTEDGHGYGIRNIQKAAEKYGGLVDIDYTGGEFMVCVMLFGV